MRRIVKINHKEVEVEESSVPAIIFNNPVFFDMSNMKGNRTTTYKIPLTRHNQSVLGILGSEDSVNDFMRTVHHFEEWRDGLPVIRNGQARLIAVSPGQAEFSVTWGVLKPIEELLKSKLSELPPMPTENTRWDENTPFFTNSDQTPGYGWLQYFTMSTAGQNLHLNDMQYHFPSIKVSYLMDHIAAYTNMQFSYGKAVREHLDEMWIPLLTRKADEATRTDPVNSSKFTISRIPYEEQAAVFECYNDPYGVAQPYQGSADTSTIRLQPESSYKVSGIIRLNRLLANLYGKTIVANFAWTNSAGEVSSKNFREKADQNGTCNIPFDFEIGTGTNDAIADNGCLLRVHVYYYEGTQHIPVVWPDKSPHMGTLHVWRKQDEVCPGQNFPLVANLPDMSAVDFIKSISFLCGLYPQPVQENEIHFDYIDRVIENPSKAVDLNNRILAHKPKSIKYTYSDYAQENHLLYEEEQLARPYYNGVIKLSDTTLARSKDIIKLKFAPSYPSTSLPVQIPLFLYDYDKAEVTGFNGDKLKPRIISARPGPRGLLWGDFHPETFGFEKIIKERYKVLTNVLRSPKVVNVDFRMTTAELYLFKATNLFYFHGKYWLLLQGTYNASGIMNAEFINVEIK